MARGRVAFKETDLVRALRGTARAGLQAQRIEIDRDGKIVVFLDKGQQPDTPAGSGANPWDQALADMGSEQ
jgi:hypothetical protein